MPSPAGPQHVRARPKIVASLVTAFLLTTAAPALAEDGYDRPGELSRVTVAPDGSAADGDSNWLAMSSDGRYMAFQSKASNLAPGHPTRAVQIYVRDLGTGLTELVSVNDSGEIADHSAYDPAISDNGRFVAFHSTAKNLGDPNGADNAYVHDRLNNKTTIASIAMDGGSPNNRSYRVDVSDDGVVAFVSRATNLVPDPQGRGHHIYIYDPSVGRVERMSESDDGTPGNGISTDPKISADGRHIAFSSESTNLISGDSNGDIDVFVRDRNSGTIEFAAVATDGGQGNHVSTQASISADGRFVAFMSYATNLVPNPLVYSLVGSVYVRDRHTGSTQNVGVENTGFRAGGTLVRPNISPDGRYVSFGSTARNLGLSYSERKADWQVYVHDRVTGTTEPVSVNSAGEEADSRTNISAVSGDGRYVGFESYANNLIPSGQDRVGHIYVRDRGAELGPVGSLKVEHGADSMLVSGRAAFTGAVISEAVAISDAAGPARDQAGANISSAQVVHRPELEDVLLRLQLTHLPWQSVFGFSRFVATPISNYGFELMANGVRYEVRANLDAPRFDPMMFLSDPQLGLALTIPRFGLFRCEATCERVGTFNGGWGTSGYEIRTSVPLSMLGLKEGDRLEALKTFAGVGTEGAGPRGDLDELALPDGRLFDLNVRVATVSPDGAAGEAPFVAADLQEGTFEAAFPAPVDPNYDLLIKVCRGETCGLSRHPIRSTILDTALALIVEGRGSNRTLHAHLSIAGDPGEGIEGRSVDFFADQQFIGSAITDSDGVATITAPPGYRGGGYVFEARFHGDESHRASAAQSAT